MTAPASATHGAAAFRLGVAWVLLWVALAVHVVDEALTGFLSVYNPTVLALRARYGFWPMPTYEFRDWLTGLATGIILLAAMSPFAFRNAGWIRPVFYVLAGVTGVMNALGQMVASLLGQTVSTVQFARPAPGFYSSPLLLAAAIFALVQLRRTRM